MRFQAFDIIGMDIYFFLIPAIAQDLFLNKWIIIFGNLSIQISKYVNIYI